MKNLSKYDFRFHTDDYEIATPEQSEKFIPLCDTADFHGEGEDGKEVWSQYGTIDDDLCTIYWATNGHPQWASKKLDQDVIAVVWEWEEPDFEDICSDWSNLIKLDTTN